MEIYKFVELTDKRYIVTSLGRVISMNYNDGGYGKELKQQTRGKGYKFVLIDGEPISIHRLVGNHSLKSGNEILQGIANSEIITGCE